MRRNTVVIVVSLLAAVLTATAAAAAVPKGTLTKVEYRELAAVQRAEKQAPKTRNLAQVAKHDCRALTDVSRLTSTQHAECVASLFFFPRLLGFTPALKQCEKAAARLTRLRCIERTTDAALRATRSFIKTNAASVGAARARGISGKCLDYLVFTPRQAVVMNKLAPALQAFAHALRVGNLVPLVNASKRLGTQLVTTLKAFEVTGSISVCRHQ